MRALATLLLLNAVGCAGPRATAAGDRTWCFEERIAGDLEELREANVWPVVPRKMPYALGVLREKTVIRITAEEASKLGATEPRGSGNHYLARASLYAHPATAEKELAELAKTARFSVEWAPEQSTVRIVTSQPTPGWGSRAQNFPVIVQAPLDIRHVVVSCYAFR